MSSITTWTYRFRGDIASEGFLTAVSRRAVSVRDRFLFQPFTQVTMECDLDRATSKRSSKGIGLRDIADGDDPLLGEFVVRHLTPRHLKRFQAYLRCGYHGQLVTRMHETIGCTWWAESGLPPECTNPALSRLGLCLEPGDAYSWDVFLASPFRGKGLGRSFYARHLEQLRARGIHRVFLWVDGKNEPALHLYRGLGFSELSRRRSVLLASRILLTQSHIFIKNSFQRPTPFDYRRVL